MHYKHKLMPCQDGEQVLLVLLAEAYLTLIIGMHKEHQIMLLEILVLLLNAFANLIEDKFFWRNSLNTNLNWVKLDNKDDLYG